MDVPLEKLAENLDKRTSLMKKQIARNYINNIIDNIAKSIEDEPIKMVDKSVSSTLRWAHGRVTLQINKENAKKYDIYTENDLKQKIQNNLSNIIKNTTVF